MTKEKNYKFKLGQEVSCSFGKGWIRAEKVDDNEPTWIRTKELVNGRFRKLSKPQYCIWHFSNKGKPTWSWVDEDEISLPLTIQMPPPPELFWCQNEYSVGEVVAVQDETKESGQRLGTVVAVVSNGFQYKVLFHDEPNSLKWDIIAPRPYEQYINAVLAAKNESDAQKAKRNLSLKEYLVSIQISHTFASTDFVEIDIESLSPEELEKVFKTS